MKPRSVSVAVAAALVVCFSGQSGAVAGGPTEQIRGHVDEMYRLVSNASERSAADQAAVRKVADRMFDWPGMARGALGKHWQERTPSERDEFVRLFAAVFERAYLSKIQLADAAHFTYLGDRVEGEHGTVKTTVTAKNGSVIAVAYRTRVGEGDLGACTTWTRRGSVWSAITGLNSIPLSRARPILRW